MQINEPETVDAGVTSVCISPDGRLVAAGSLDTIVRIWDVASGLLVERLKGHKDSVYSVAFTPDGKGLVSGSLDKTLKYWDVRPALAGLGSSSGSSRKDSIAGGAGPGGGGGVGNGKKEGGEKGSACTMNFAGHKVRGRGFGRGFGRARSADVSFRSQDYVLSVAVSHDGQWVVSGSKDRGVQFWEARTAVVQLMLQGHKNSGERRVGRARFCSLMRVAVISIDLSPAASLLATGSGDWQARICACARRARRERNR